MFRSKQVLFSILILISFLVTLLFRFSNLGIAQEIITLRISTWPADPAEENLYKKWAQEFEKLHPNIKVKVEVIPTGYAEKIMTSAAAGQLPDIFRSAGSDLPERVENGLYMPLKKEWLRQINLSDLYPVVRDGGTYKGKLYGWDPHLSAYCLHYNKDHFKEAGIAPPSSSWTWETVTKVAAKLTKKTGERIERYGLQCDELNRWWIIITWTLGGEVFDKEYTKPLFPSPETINAAKYIKDLATVYSVSPPPGQAGGLGAREAFQSGRCSMLFDGIWMNRFFNMKKELNHGTAVIPKGVKRATMAIPCLWGISSQTKHPEEAWELLKFWVNVEHALEFCDYGGPDAYGIPVWKSALKDPRWKVSDLLKTQVLMSSYSRTDPIFLGAGRWSWEMLLPTLQAIVLGQKDINQALTELASKTQDLLRSGKK